MPACTVGNRAIEIDSQEAVSRFLNVHGESGGLTVSQFLNVHGKVVNFSKFTEIARAPGAYELIKSGPGLPPAH